MGCIVVMKPIIGANLVKDGVQKLRINVKYVIIEQEKDQEQKLRNSNQLNGLKLIEIFFLKMVQVNEHQLLQ